MNFIDPNQQLKYSLLRDEINDFIDENPTNHTIIDIKDVEKCIEEITRLRSQFRSIYILFSSSLSANVNEENFSDGSQLYSYSCQRIYYKC